MSLTVSNDGIILKFRSVNCLSISRPLKQQSKVAVRCRSQEYLIGNVSATYYHESMIEKEIPLFFVFEISFYLS